MGRRYFGRDLTNIEDASAKHGSDTHKFVEYGDFGGSKPAFKPSYRPLTSNVGSKSSSAFPQFDANREYGSYIPVMHLMQNQEDHDYLSKNKQAPYTSNVTPMQNRLSLQLAQDNHKFESCEEEEEPQQPPKSMMSPERCMNMEPVMAGFPAHVNLLRETDNVYLFNKQMNFPGSDFVNFNNIPFANIWSHLIFKRVDESLTLE